MSQVIKVSIALAFSLLLSPLAFGQVKFGIQGGGGLSNAIYKVPVEHTPTAIAVFHLGGIVDIGPTEGLSFETGLLFQEKGFQQTIRFSGFEFETTNRLYYLQVPAKVTLHGRGIYAAVGPYASVAVGGQQKNQLLPTTDALESGTSTRNLNFGDALTDDFKPFEFGAVVELGYESKTGLRFLLQYQNGLSNVQPNAVIDAHYGSKSYSYSVGLSVAYLFNFNGI